MTEESEPFYIDADLYMWRLEEYKKTKINVEPEHVVIDAPVDCSPVSNKARCWPVVKDSIYNTVSVITDIYINKIDYL